MDLLLVQNHHEIKEAKDQLGENYNIIQKIAWTPFAVDGLKHENVEYKTSADYQFQPYPANLLDVEFLKFRKWCQRLDTHIQHVVLEAEQLKINPFLNILQAFRIIVFLYFQEVEKLRLIVNKEKAETVYYFHYSGNESGLLSGLIDQLEKQNVWNNRFVRLISENRPQSLFNKDRIVPVWFTKPNVFKSFARHILRRTKYKEHLEFLSGISRYKFFNKRAKTILVLTHNNEFGKLIENLKNSDNYKCIYWEDLVFQYEPQLSSISNNITEFIHNDKFIRNWLVRCDLDLFDLLVPDIQNVLSNFLPKYISTVKIFLDLQKSMKFDLVITMMPLTQWEVIFDQCVELDVPVVVFLHGGTLGLLEGLEPTYPYSFNQSGSAKLYKFLYSDVISDFCNKNYKKNELNNPVNVAVGSIYFDELEKRYSSIKCLAKENLQICYVCAPVGLYNSCFKCGVYDDAALYKMRYEVVELFRKAINIHTTFKLGYNTEKHILLDKTLIKGNELNISALPSNCRLTDIIENYDLFILEIASTTLIEILASNKPVLLYKDPIAFNFSNENTPLLESRVTIANSTSEFYKHIKDIVDNLHNANVFTDTNHEDRRFFNTFTKSNNKSAITNSVDKIKTIVSKTIDPEDFALSS